jgi:uncharacterized protein
MEKMKTKSLNEVIKIINSIKPNLVKKYHTKLIGIFGSYVRNEQKEDSDIDIFIEFETEHKTFDNYIELKFFLEKILNSKVDITIRSAIREEIKENILKEAVYV